MDQQGFDDLAPDLFAPVAPKPAVGYRGPAVCQIAGITYRQLDYWARTELVTPSVKAAAGSGSQRLYSFSDILLLRIVKRLLNAGISLQNIRIAVNELRGRNTKDLTSLTLLCDGTTVYECTDDHEVIDLLRAGQGVFALAVGVTMRELTADVAELPAEPAQPVAADRPTDQLAARRSRRTA